MIRRLAAFVVCTAGVAAIACYPIESPPGGIASVTLVLAPYPAVVAGDTIRDTAGVVQPLRAYAFGTRGETLAVKPTFVLLDSGAHLVGNEVVGDSARTTPVRIVASFGALQTPPCSVYVTVAPTTLAAVTATDGSGHTTDTLKAAPDTAWSANSFSLQLKVAGGANDSTPIPGWVASYRVEYAPASKDTAPGAYVLDGLSHPTHGDTADASGILARQIALRAGALTDTALVLGHKVDSIVVSVSASYRRQPLAGSPARIVIPVKFKGFSTP